MFEDTVLEFRERFDEIIDELLDMHFDSLIKDLQGKPSEPTDEEAARILELETELVIVMDFLKNANK